MKAGEYITKRFSAVGRALGYKRFLIPSIFSGIFTVYGIFQKVFENLPDIGAFWIAGFGVIFVVVWACADRIITLEDPSPLKIVKEYRVILPDDWRGVVLKVKNTSPNQTMRKVKIRALPIDRNTNAMTDVLETLGRMAGGNKTSFKAVDINPGQIEDYLLCKAKPRKYPSYLYVWKNKKWAEDNRVTEAIFYVNCSADNMPEKKWKILIKVSGATLMGHNIQWKNMGEI